jgi:hypothetical protein
MKKPQTTTPEPKAGSTWERLEEFARQHIQHFIQALLEEGVPMLLGRATSARREAVDATPGYRNGHGKPRRLKLTSGTITVRRPGSETSAAKRFKKAENAIALIWKLL